MGETTARVEGLNVLMAWLPEMAMAWPFRSCDQLATIQCLFALATAGSAIAAICLRSVHEHARCTGFLRTSAILPLLATIRRHSRLEQPAHGDSTSVCTPLAPISRTKVHAHDKPPDASEIKAHVHDKPPLPNFDASRHCRAVPAGRNTCCCDSM